MKVFSVVPHPITVSYKLGKATKKVRDTVSIMTGRNEIADDVWKSIKDEPCIQSRIDGGYMRSSNSVKDDLTSKEKADLMGVPSRGFIGELCAKAAPVPTGERAPGSNDFFTFEEQKERGLV